jgi:hypothetical protein
VVAVEDPRHGNILGPSMWGFPPPGFDASGSFDLSCASGTILPRVDSRVATGACQSRRDRSSMIKIRMRPFGDCPWAACGVQRSGTGPGVPGMVSNLLSWSFVAHPSALVNPCHACVRSMAAKSPRLPRVVDRLVSFPRLPERCRSWQWSCLTRLPYSMHSFSTQMTDRHGRHFLGQSAQGFPSHLPAYSSIM